MAPLLGGRNSEYAIKLGSSLTPYVYNGVSHGKLFTISTQLRFDELVKRPA